MQDNIEDDDLFVKLEKKNPGSEEIIYYYSREQRLAKASQRVREFNEAQGKPKFIGKTRFIRAVAGHRGNLLILMSILVIFLMYFIHGRVTAPSSIDFMLGNNTLTVSVNEEESLLFLSVRKVSRPDRSDAFPYTGAVDIMISPIQENPEEAPVFSHRIFFTNNSTENYLLSLPFDGNRFITIFQTEYEIIARTVSR